MNNLLRQTIVKKVDFPGSSPYSEAFNAEGYAGGMFTGPQDENYVELYASDSESGTFLPIVRADATGLITEHMITPTPAGAVYMSMPDEVFPAKWLKFAIVDDTYAPQNAIAQTFTVILKS